jgi:hypothetical protein
MDRCGGLGAFTGPEVKTVWVIGIGAVKKSAVEEEEKGRGEAEIKKVNKATSATASE